MGGLGGGGEGGWKELLELGLGGWVDGWVGGWAVHLKVVHFTHVGKLLYNREDS